MTKKITPAMWIEGMMGTATNTLHMREARQAFINAMRVPTAPDSDAPWKFIFHLPYEVYGGLQAKNIPCTPETIHKVYDILFDPMMLNTLLRPTEVGKPASQDPAPMMLLPDPEPFSLPPDLSSDPRERAFQLRMRTSFVEDEKLKSALATALKANHDECRVQPNMGLAIFEAQKILASAVAHIVESTYPDALTSPSHDIWNKEVVSHIVFYLRDAVLRYTTQTLFTDAVSPPDRTGPK